jgi:hypothetical protein
MKRSEALKIIDEQYSKYVDDLVKIDVDNEDVMGSFVKLSERVLTALEKAGMLPPSIELPSFGTRDNAWEREE